MEGHVKLFYQSHAKRAFAFSCRVNAAVPQFAIATAASYYTMLTGEESLGAAGWVVFCRTPTTYYVDQQQSRDKSRIPRNFCPLL